MPTRFQPCTLLAPTVPTRFVQTFWIDPLLVMKNIYYSVWFTRSDIAYQLLSLLKRQSIVVEVDRSSIVDTMSTLE